ncbi:MAG TPA: transporter substrate-binding domain-containing protein [bacterium]|nr:transporter substrate-binding domain-containing protein [bacterium]
MKKPFLILAVLGILFFISCSGDENGIVLTPEEISWLKEHDGRIRIAPDPFDPPVEFFNEKGVYTGISADYIALFEKRFKIKFDIVKAESFEAVMAMAKNREIDIVTAISESDERKEFLNFTEPYIDDPIVIVVRKDTPGYLTTDNLGEKKLTYVKNYALHRELTENYSHLQLLPVDDERTGLRNVSFGVADAMIIDLPSASYYIEKDGLLNLRVAGDENIYSRYSFAVRKDSPVLFSIMNKALGGVSRKEHDEIRAKWIKLDHPTYWLSFEFISTVSLLFALLSVLTAVFFIYRMRMNRKLQEHISALISEQSRTRDFEEKYRTAAAKLETAPAPVENTEEEHVKYETSRLSDDTLKEYLRVLLKYMDEKKPYLNQNLSLKILADELSMYPHHISQLLSICLDRNFNNFISEYRVEDVKQMFMDADYDEDTILSIAFQAGFNSKASFNSIFKKFTGSTPSQYRSACLKKRGVDVTG